jgi:low temperature requirement protein LtrA
VSEHGKRSLLREQHSGHAPVGYMELFFDLVYVFAVTQLSHNLLQHLDWFGALQTAILFLAVWWAWIYTTWATNWLDPDRAANRLLIGAVMVGSLLMSSAIPQAFGKYGLAFALAYVAMQILRSLYVALALGEWRPGGLKSLTRIAIWFGVSAAPWIAGALTADPWARLCWWAGALLIEYLAPITLYPVPGLGRSRSEDWAIAGGHMAERCALFIIIALGEGLLVTGATFGGLDVTPTYVAALLAAFLGSFAMWWVYFDIGAKRGAEHIEHHANPGLIGRNAFTYWHAPIIAGIIMMAVTDELTMAHPLEPIHADFLAVTIGGMLLFLGGAMTFKRISSGDPWFPVSHSAGLILIAVLGLWGWFAHPHMLVFSMGTVVIFAVVALWEWGSYHGGWIGRLDKRNPWLASKVRSYGERRIAARQDQRSD